MCSNRFVFVMRNAISSVERVLLYDGAGLKTVCNTMTLMLIGLVVLIVADKKSCAADPVTIRSPLSTDDAIRSFVLASPELKVELAAAEPEVVDPVAIAFGADGSMWVVEMRDYPYGPKPGSSEKPKSRIKRLFDHNHDGRFETATVFADELLFATGVLPWRDGVIVTLAGEIAFFADRDEDGKADFHETWFQGFSQENSQLRANHPTFGPDGFIYVANGLRGGSVVAVKPEWKKPGQPLPLAGFDFRFNPVTGEYGAVAGHGQFGLCFDDFGNRFVCSNRNPLQHIVLEDHFSRRNPAFAIKTTVQDVAAWGEKSKLYPISAAWTTSNLHANQFTAACGVTIYRGDGLPPENKGNAFVCDPTANLVHRETLVPSGASFISHSSDGQQEFLASTDTWFRPVNLVNGPDGTLYIVDMYRAVIEHPDWMPAELKSRKDLNDGSDRGRIWRVKSEELIMPQERHDHSLDKLTIHQLIRLLDHANAWHRETAFRLLLERDREVVLDGLKLDWKQNRLTRSRLPVLWLIRTLDPRLTPAVLAWSEVDNRDARVREQVFASIGDNLDELLPDDVVNLAAEETDDRVRFRLALDLSGRSQDVAIERKALIKLLDRGLEDPWLRVAVGTMKSDPPDALLKELLEHWKNQKSLPAGGAKLVEQLSEVCGGHLDAESARTLLEQLLQFPGSDASEAEMDVTAAGIRGLGLGAARRGLTFASFRDEINGDRREQWRNFMEQLRERVRNSETEPQCRLDLIRTLPFGEATESAATLLELGFSGSDTSIKLAAFDALVSLSDPLVGQKVIAEFATQTPQIRRALLEVLLANEERIALLLDRIEQGIIKTTEIDAIRQTRLMKQGNPLLRTRAEKLFAVAIDLDRASVLEKYQGALDQPGEAERGRAIFEKNCVTCHRVGNLGVNVGPDISDTRDKLPPYLLMNILDPNRAVDGNYFGYTLVTEQGKSYTGLIKSETATSLTIRMPEGKEVTVLRTEVEALKTGGQSLMPVGFEKTITVEQMSDLISYLKNWRYLDGSIPLR